MRRGASIAVVIPALNEEPSIGRVLDEIPDWVDEVVVADNGSTDGTARAAEEHGARVVYEARRGYGSACLAALRTLGDPDIVVFLDGDYSDHPGEMDRLVDPILDGRAEMVIGSRVLGKREPGALTPQQRFGNRLACILIRLFWKAEFTDLGPFRAVRHSTLRRLGMRDPDYGWTVEMQIRAARLGVPLMEVPVRYRRRIGRSKVSGTLRGMIGAGTKILGIIFLSAVRPQPPGPAERSPETGRCRIVVFTRYPEPGTTKTRLIPLLGAEGAADLQRRMTEQTISRVRRFCAARPDVEFAVAYAGGDEKRMRDWLGQGVRLRPQGPGDLGARMRRAVEESSAEGYGAVVLVGTDCPGLQTDHLRDAIDALEDHDLVFGPARDGGYYLIGCTRPIPALFDGIPWGTSGVLERSLDAARREGCRVRRIAELEDVDRPEDLAVWERWGNGPEAEKDSR